MRGEEGRIHFHFHFCDIAGVPDTAATRTDRSRTNRFSADRLAAPQLRGSASGVRGVMTITDLLYRSSQLFRTACVPNELHDLH